MGLRNWFGKILDFGGKELGKAEDVVHHPLYPISAYIEQVAPGVLWRGSWPDKKALAMLKQMGIATVVNLCAERSQDADVVAAGMRSVNIPIVDNTAPRDLDVLVFLYEVKVHPPLYIHCEQGIGRTGCLVAAFRVLVENMSPADALTEAKKFGLAIPCQQQFILGLSASKFANSPITGAKK